MEAFFTRPDVNFSEHCDKHFRDFLQWIAHLGLLSLLLQMPLPALSLDIDQRLNRGLYDSEGHRLM